MNKKSIIAAISLICLLALIGGTVSFFTTTGKAKNVVTSSALDIELVMLEASDTGTKPASGSVEILPGETKSRIAMVKNTNKEPAWIRISLAIESSGEIIDLADGNIKLEGLNNTEWTYKDGYWYYKEALDPGDTTKELFTGLTLDASAGSEVEGAEMNIKVNAEATQSKNNGESALDAKGWPEA